MLELIATLCSGVFFGAALYISVGQHPAALEAGDGQRIGPERPLSISEQTDQTI